MWKRYKGIGSGHVALGIRRSARAGGVDGYARRQKRISDRLIWVLPVPPAITGGVIDASGGRNLGEEIVDLVTQAVNIVGGTLRRGQHLTR